MGGSVRTRLDFTNDLPTGETISSVDYVTILDAGGRDVTAEVRGSSPQAPSIDPTGKIVSFWKEPASGAEQPAGTYKVKCRAILTNSEKPIALGDGARLIFLEIVGD